MGERRRGGRRRSNESEQSFTVPRSRTVNRREMRDAESIEWIKVRLAEA